MSASSPLDGVGRSPTQSLVGFIWILAPVTSRCYIVFCGLVAGTARGICLMVPAGPGPGRSQTLGQHCRGVAALAILKAVPARVQERGWGAAYSQVLHITVSSCTNQTNHQVGRAAPWYSQGTYNNVGSLLQHTHKSLQGQHPGVWADYCP